MIQKKTNELNILSARTALPTVEVDLDMLPSGYIEPRRSC